MKRCVLAWTAGIAISNGAAFAHHSISGIYEMGEEIRIEGIVEEFHFIHPHPFVNLEVRPDGGSAQQWRLEMDNRSELARIGMTGETLKPGDRVAVTGHPARTRPHALYISRLDRPADGFGYEQVGNRPRIRSPRP